MNKLLSILFALIPYMSIAHPGHEGDHGDEGYTIIHFFNSPVHYIFLISVIVAAIAAIYFKGRSPINKRANA